MAGNQYRLGVVLDNVTWGVFESSRLVTNEVIFVFNEADERDLIVDIDSIDYKQQQCLSAGK